MMTTAGIRAEFARTTPPRLRFTRSSALEGFTIRTSLVVVALIVVDQLRSARSHPMKFVDSTKLPKRFDSEQIRSILPACQPQEGSPANTFTKDEILELQKALPQLDIRPPRRENGAPRADQLDICGPWTAPNSQGDEVTEEVALDWHSAPRFDSKSVEIPRAFRERVRSGEFTGPTNAHCPGFLQCNLVVLPQGPIAYDFLLFCQRNPQACPLIEVCDVGSACPVGVAPTADLRTDIPKYAIYRDGVLVEERTDVTDVWPEQSVAFLIGCSFTYDGALQDAGIPLRSAEAGKNVPMYRTSLACRPSGSLKGTMVVSMKPIPALQISKHVEVTARFPHAHGGPVCIGRPDMIGIADIDKPEWGDPIEVGPTDVAVFHACGVTPQSVLMDSKVPFCITHAAGHMFVTDLPADMGK